MQLHILSRQFGGDSRLARRNGYREKPVLALHEAKAGAAATVITVGYVRDILHRGKTEFTLLMAGVLSTY